MPAVLGRLIRALERRWAPWVVILFGVLLVSPSISTGLGGDDYVIASQLRADRTITGLSRDHEDLFVFAPRDSTAAHALIEDGVLPWWADPSARFSCLRPLTSLSHALDAALFPASPALWHAQNLFWFFVALAAVWMLYRAVLHAGTASLALLLFALDDAHGPAVGWVASRHTLMALAFTALSVAMFAKWRGGFRPGAILGPVLLGAGLLSSELVLGACAYLLGYALFVDDGPLARRLARLWGYAAVVLVWAVVHVVGGYGIVGTSQYLDPVHEPAVFFREAIFRWPVLLLSQLLFPWADLWPVYSSVHRFLPYAVWAFALVVLGCVGWVIRPLLERDRTLRFLAFGMLLSAVLSCAALPTDRSLALVGIGAMALAAALLDAYARGATPPGYRRRFAFSASLIVGLQGVTNLYWLPARSRTNAIFSPIFTRANDSVPKSEDIGQKSVILVNPPLEPLVQYMAFMRDALGETRPRRVRILSTGASAVAITRTDERTLRIRPSAGFLASPADTMLRSPRRPLSLGAIELSDVTIEITELTPDRRPAEAVFRFQRTLEDPSLVWLRWGTRTYEHFQVPSVGETVRLDAVNFLGLFGP